MVQLNESWVKKIGEHFKWEEDLLWEHICQLFPYLSHMFQNNYTNNYVLCK